MRKRSAHAEERDGVEENSPGVGVSCTGKMGWRAVPEQTGSWEMVRLGQRRF